MQGRTQRERLSNWGMEGYDRDACLGDIYLGSFHETSAMKLHSG